MDKRIFSEETIEQKIYKQISRCLGNDETIALGREFDIILPNGAKKLKWPQNTAIEVKYRLIYNSFSRIKELYDKIRPQKLLVVVVEDSVSSFRLESNAHMSKRNIEVLSYQKFKHLVNSITTDENTQEIAERHEEDAYIKDNNLNIRRKAKESLRNSKISLFLGAGVSASAGVVTWNGLLEQLCIKKGLSKIDSDIDSVVKGRYVIDEYKKQERELPDEFYEDMRNILYANIHPSKLINSISSLIAKSSIESIISYNYDDLVEQKVKEDKPCYSVYDKSRPIDGNSLHVYHVHGFIPQSGDCSPIILGEKEYHRIYQESYNWGNVEQLHALCRSVCFFIGLSMADPNLRRLIDISIDGGEVEPVHFVFLRKIEYDVPFMEKIMRGFGINCIWYDKHEELPIIIDSLVS